MVGSQYVHPFKNACFGFQAHLKSHDWVKSIQWEGNPCQTLAEVFKEKNSASFSPRHPHAKLFKDKTSVTFWLGPNLTAKIFHSVTGKPRQTSTS